MAGTANLPMHFSSQKNVYAVKRKKRKKKTNKTTGL